jgi:hypothetical protein
MLRCTVAAVRELEVFGAMCPCGGGMIRTYSGVLTVLQTIVGYVDSESSEYVDLFRRLFHHLFNKHFSIDIQTVEVQ